MILSVVIAVLLLARARSESSHPTLALDETSAAAVEDGVLLKTVTSSKLRLVLAVGLEGTGHAFGERPFTTNANIVDRARQNCFSRILLRTLAAKCALEAICLFRFRHKIETSLDRLLARCGSE